MTERTQWSPESIAAHRRGDAMTLLSVGFDPMEGWLRCWPQKTRPTGRLREPAQTLDSGWALFSPSGAIVCDFSPLSQQINSRIEQWLSARRDFNGVGGGLRRPLAPRLRVAARAAFVETAQSSQPIGDQVAIVQAIPHVTATPGPKPSRGRESKAERMRREKQGGARRRAPNGQQDRLSALYRRQQINRDERRWESLEKAVLRITGECVEASELFSCAQKVRPPELAEWRLWSHDGALDFADGSYAKRGLDAYRAFLLAQLGAADLAQGLAEESGEGQEAEAAGPEGENLRRAARL